MSRSAVWSLYRRLIRVEDEQEQLPEPARTHAASNALRQIAAQGLQSAGDQVVNAKTVLPWLLSVLGAPATLLALLVPVRESGSMLPQAALTPWLRQRPVRKSAWVLGAAVQAAAVVAMAVVTATGRGWVAGVGIVAALAVFALGRALCSLASKDVLGRTVSLGQRGQINGTVTVIAGIVALTLGIALQRLGDGAGVAVLAVLLGLSALAWVLAIVVYAGIREPAAEPEPAAQTPGWVRTSWELLRSDRTFRRFVTVRSLLLVSALSTPFIVAMGVAHEDANLSGLGLFVLAQGLANLLGGRSFGRLADRSSRRLMVWCAAIASGVIVVFLLAQRFPGLAESSWLYPATYFLIAVVHVGTRVARKTYVIDVTEGDQRTEYVAVSNTVMGALLLAVGAITGLLATWGNEWALVLLAGLGFAGALLGRGLPEAGARG